MVFRESFPNNVLTVTCPIQLGFTNASMFTRGRVRFLSSDGISFAHPVPIGSILLLRSQILHTDVSYGCPLVVSRIALSFTSFLR